MLQGNRLKKLRENGGYTHQQLAEALELALPQIWRYESGKTDPSSDVLARMAQVFNVSVDYLLGLIDEPLPPGASGLDLSGKELAVLGALRRGENYEAIKIITSDN